MGLVVVKCGGAAGGSGAPPCARVAAAVRRGRRGVLAHGGSAEIERLARRLGVAQRRLVAPDGVATRYTDASTLEVVMLALARVKTRLVTTLGTEGAPAIGLTGLDGGLLLARRKRAHRALLEGRLVV